MNRMNESEGRERQTIAAAAAAAVANHAHSRVAGEYTHRSPNTDWTCAEMRRRIEKRRKERQTDKEEEGDGV